MKALPAGWPTDLRAQEGGSAYVWLYELTLPTTPTPSIVRLTGHNAAVTYGGQTYTPWPISHTGSPETSAGSLGGVTITAANVDRQFQAYLEDFAYLTGQQVTIRLARLVDMSAVAEHQYTVTAAASTERTISLTLAAEIVGVGAALGRHAYRDLCGWVYKSADCGYAGIIAACAKSLKDCRLHGNQTRFGAFPGIPQEAVIIR